MRGFSKASMINSFLQEMEQDEARSNDPDYACYRPDLSAEELVKVLNYSKKNFSQSKLPTKPGLMKEILRFHGAFAASKLKNMNRDQLIGTLYQVLGTTPRRRVTAKQYHRFGLSFDYEGTSLPSLPYRDGTSSADLKAMFELYPHSTIKINIDQLKKELSGYYNTKKTGTKKELLQRLKENLGCKDIHVNEYYTYKEVCCWENEQAALQAKFDEERREWQVLMENDKENVRLIENAKRKRKEEEKQESEVKAKKQRVAATRPWAANPYDPNKFPQATMEANWKKCHPGLSFPYSGSCLPKPEEFEQVLDDYLIDSSRYGHHMLAYLEKGYGTFGGHMNPTHSFMTNDGLKRIHGRQCRHVGTSHAYAVDVVRPRVTRTANFRYRNGL